MSAPAFPLDAPLAHRDKRGRWVTEGRRALLALSDKQEAIAAALGVSRQAVGKILAGCTRPSPETMWTIEVRFGIPMAAWALAPLEVDATSQPMVARESSTPAPRVPQGELQNDDGRAA